MSFTVVIPARYASTRLPAKPLADIAGKPMIVHVLERGLAVVVLSAGALADDSLRRAAEDAADRRPAALA